MFLPMLLVPTSANAYFYSGNDLTGYCTVPARPSLACLHFVMGVLDGWYFQKPNECLPPEATGGQLTEVVVKYMRDNPAKLHETAVSVIFFAMYEAFPCDDW